MRDDDDAIDHFWPVEHGLDVLQIGIVHVVEHEAKVSCFGNGVIRFRLWVFHEADFTTRKLAAAEVGVHEILALGGAAVEHGGVFRLFLVRTIFSLLV